MKKYITIYMNNIHKIIIMYTRTTFSLDSQNLETLKKVANSKQIKSLSRFVNNILSEFLKNYQKQKKISKMKKHYQKYADQFDHKSFSALEEGMLTDLDK